MCIIEHIHTSTECIYEHIYWTYIHEYFEQIWTYLLNIYTRVLRKITNIFIKHIYTSTENNCEIFIEHKYTSTENNYEIFIEHKYTSTENNYDHMYWTYIYEHWEQLRIYVLNIYTRVLKQWKNIHEYWEQLWTHLSNIYTRVLRTYEIWKTHKKRAETWVTRPHRIWGKSTTRLAYTSALSYVGVVSAVWLHIKFITIFILNIEHVPLAMYSKASMTRTPMTRLPWLIPTPSRKHTYIILTPLNPILYIVKLEFAGVYIIFLFSAQNIDCGYLLEPPRRGGSNEYLQSMFWAEIWKVSEFFIWKFSVFWRWNFLCIWIGVFS